MPRMGRTGRRLAGWEGQPLAAHELRSAIVTGANAADGIGLAILHELLARGAQRVAGSYREPARSAPLLTLARTDDRVLAAELDVTSDASVAAFAGWCAEHFEAVDLLVNNAGVGSVDGTVVTASLADLEQSIQTHGVGMLRVARAVLPLMGPGAVVLNVSSSLGSLEGMGAGSTFYGPAKALQNALTRQLAAALRPDGIIACSVGPGWVATAMGGSGAPRTPQQAAVDLLNLAARATLDDAGTFRNYEGRTIPW